MIELLVAAVLGLVVIGISTMVFTSAVTSAPKSATRGGEIQKARTTMERITRELRQGSTVSSATATQLAIVTFVARASCGGAAATTARSCRVTYTCTAGACSRVESNPDGSGPGPSQQVVSGLQSSSVFSYTPSAAAPTYVGVTMVVDAGGGEDAITLSDGVALRNPVSS